MKEGGLVTLEGVQMEHAALKALNSDIFLQLSQAMKKIDSGNTSKPDARPNDKSKKRALVNVLGARIKSNGTELG